MPAGGIIPARSFRMIFSTCCAFCSGCANIHRGPREISQLRVDPVAHDTILFHQLTLLLDSGPIVDILGERNFEACGKGEPGRQKPGQAHRSRPVVS